MYESFKIKMEWFCNHLECLSVLTLVQQAETYECTIQTVWEQRYQIVSYLPHISSEPPCMAATMSSVLVSLIETKSLKELSLGGVKINVLFFLFYSSMC